MFGVLSVRLRSSFRRRQWFLWHPIFRFDRITWRQNGQLLFPIFFRCHSGYHRLGIGSRANFNDSFLRQYFCDGRLSSFHLFPSFFLHLKKCLTHLMNRLHLSDRDPLGVEFGWMAIAIGLSRFRRKFGRPCVWRSGRTGRCHHDRTEKWPFWQKWEHQPYPTAFCSCQ